MQRQTVVETRYGKLQGYFNGRCRLFAGIPYAAPPGGERRFRSPEPPTPWTGVRDATHFGPIQPQSPSRFEKFYGPDPQPQSEDSLRLNVWTPATDAEPRPVLVFIHGGAFVSGSGSLPMYHGEAFAVRHGLVAVTLNYRLAEGGSLYLGYLDADYATSGNTGLLDVMAALEWIRDNIAAFGGDPGNVTVCGQSAGGHTVLALMTAPRARGLLHRAISMSAARLTPLRNIDQAIATSERFLALAGVQTVEALQKLPIEALLAARRQLMRTTSPWHTPWGTLVDNEVLPEQPLTAAAAGRLAPVPLLIGACREDYRPYPSVLPPDTVPPDDAAVARLFDSLDRDGTHLVREYRELLGSVTPTDLFVAAMGDFSFRQTAIKFAERHALYQPTFMYDFRWASPVQHGTIGAGHTVDIPFALHTLWTPHTPYHLGDHPPVALADQMHEAWSTFAHTGRPAAAAMPAWPPYDTGQRPTMALDVQSTVVCDPEPARRRYWAEVT
jgi:para-nitrobenzyl esterase